VISIGSRMTGLMMAFVMIGLAEHSCRAAAGDWRVESRLDVAQVWAGHPVGFCLITHKDRQFAAYYDADRNMTVASRKLGESKWTYSILPQKVVWDSHNYVTMVVDDDGFIHLSGNMHCVPLIYLRTTKPLDAATFERVPAMVGQREGKCTYPTFFRGPNKELIFTYRDGSSGNGDQLYNVYDHATKTWRRLLDQPLTSGEGLMNAYFNGPTLGPDGNYHLCWVWRDHGGCETNHDLSYARSKDLIHWTKSDGSALELPITIGKAEIVDPVPAKGGMINGNTRIGFDSRKRVIISYHKFDENGKTQAYNARLEDGKWKIYKTSDWDYRWYFEGGGAIVFEVHIGNVSPAGPGQLSQSFSHKVHGSGVWRLDEETLKPVGLIESKRSTPSEMHKLESDFPGMEVRFCGDSGEFRDPNAKYMLRWETLPANRDRPRAGDLPGPAMMRLYKLVEE